MKKIILLDNTNFENYPTGGTLSFNKQLLKVFSSSKIAIVGITTNNNLKLREWTTVNINNEDYDFFPFMYVSCMENKPLIPLRIKSLYYLTISIQKIRKKGILNVFTQTPQFLFALKYFEWNSICFCFAGLGNSVGLSRYKYLRFLGNVFEKKLVSILRYNVDTIFAAADKRSIENFCNKYSNLLKPNDIVSFPTRFDKDIFHPLDMKSCRNNLSLSLDSKILVALGRISWVKGWELLCEIIELKNNEDYQLIFIGDGEDRVKLENEYSHLIKENKIIITGFLSPNKVVQYLNASNVVLTASYYEGWSTAMVEAIACGKPIVSTDVSGAKDLILQGKNGFILQDRNPKEFLEYIEKAIELKDVEILSTNIAKKYSLETLRVDLIENWKNMHYENSKEDLLL